MNRTDQIEFCQNAEERARTTFAKWRDDAAFEAALSKYDHKAQEERKVARRA
ncbi:hypothetical protein [Azospirillum sp. TSH64]|uniref:hypothetical protein n=1 Tax=Azospirillum sp. TSH64 TaxID=652740 RepID=UPI0013049B5B|nr:hypothetical protein [Azospirillum sp. TSH64]